MAEEDRRISALMEGRPEDIATGGADWYSLEQDGGPMSLPDFMGRAFRFTGLMWQDSYRREGVDAVAASMLATEMINFELLNVNQVGRPAPLDIRSARQWASRSRMANKIYRQVPEKNFTALVADMWQNIRQMPLQDVLRLNGRFGLIGVVRAIYQANAVDPEAGSDFRVLMVEVTEALRSMRGIIESRNAQTASVLSPTRTLLDALRERNAAFTEVASEVLERMTGANSSISGERTPAASLPEEDGNSGTYRCEETSTKRKATSIMGPMPPSKKARK
ncbi:unnamed protein product [Peniophora sp. CBMAI 1063]|nr:unnamed protein product [Peniophora sp. CBMAI 1063]